MLIQGFVSEVEDGLTPIASITVELSPSSLLLLVCLIEAESTAGEKFTWAKGQSKATQQREYLSGVLGAKVSLSKSLSSLNKFFKKLNSGKVSSTSFLVMASDNGGFIRHEDVVINDDEIVLPREPNDVFLWCRESSGFPEDFPAELRAFAEQIGFTWEMVEKCRLQRYNEEERGVIGGQWFPSRNSLLDLTVSRHLARPVMLYNQLPQNGLV